MPTPLAHRSATPCEPAQQNTPSTAPVLHGPAAACSPCFNCYLGTGSAASSRQGASTHGGESPTVQLAARVVKHLCVTCHASRRHSPPTAMAPDLAHAH
jgi:hypothetical protein